MIGGHKLKNKRFLGKIVYGYNHLEEYLLIGSLVFSVLLVFFQVVMRTVFKNSLSWSEELARYLFIWQTWLGVSIAFKEDEHIKVTLIYNIVKSKKIQAIIDFFADTIWFLFSFFLIFNGAKLVSSIVSRNVTSSGLGLPMALVYMVFPISSVLICIRLLPKLKNKMSLIFKKEDGGDNL